LAEFNADFAPLSEIMVGILDEYLHRDEGYFIYHSIIGSPFYNVINNEFAGRMVHLKPAADRVLAAISEVWKVNK
jgi:hypothetical protein